MKQLLSILRLSSSDHPSLPSFFLWLYSPLLTDIRWPQFFLFNDLNFFCFFFHRSGGSRLCDNGFPFLLFFWKWRSRKSLLDNGICVSWFPFENEVFFHNEFDFLVSTRTWSICLSILNYKMRISCTYKKYLACLLPINVPFSKSFIEITANIILVW